METFFCLLMEYVEARIEIKILSGLLIFSPEKDWTKFIVRGYWIVHIFLQLINQKVSMRP